MAEKEPWRIDKQSVHWRVLKGWLSERFSQWLEKKAKQFNVSADDLLVEIIETIRRISWLTLNILEKETDKQVYLPFTIILDDCFEINGLMMAIIKDENPEFFCNQKEVRQKLQMNYLSIWLHQIRHYLTELNGGYVFYGTACDLGIAIYDKVIMNLMDNFSKKNQETFLKTIVEEIFHYFCFQVNDLRHQKMIAEKKQRTIGIRNI